MTQSSQAAFRFPEVRVVEASAGSGKTFCLARRYVQLLLHAGSTPDTVPMRPILAITFTNKAAFEMKARILEFLKRLALGCMDEGVRQDIIAPLGLDPKTAARQAFQLMETLIQHYNFFQVQTIDSFINALLSGCAFRIGLSANFKIRRNSREYLAMALDRLIDRTRSEPGMEAAFRNFLQQYLFLENKPGWFPKDDILALFKALYQQTNTYGAAFIPYDLDGQDLLKMKQQIMSRMRELQSALPPETDKRFVDGLEKFCRRYQQSFDFDRVSDYFARENVPVRKGAEVPAALQKLWDDIHQRLVHLSEAEAGALFNPYLDLFDEMLQEFQQLAARDDVLFLEELNRKAGMLFEEGGITVEELYYRLATRFRHYLMDEFQDTSVLQWRNLHLMVEEALSTGGSLFYVGDKKQAIYGFRGGEVDLFDRIQQAFRHFNVRPQRLERNYRSREAIVTFNNQVFSWENLQRFLAAKQQRDEEKKKKHAVCFSRDDLAALANVFASARQEWRPDHSGGVVRVERISGRRKEDRDEQTRQRLLDWITDLRPRYALKDIAVLTRSNREIEQITSWLLEAGIFVESERTLNIRDHPVVKELLALLRFLSSPIDNPAFAHFLLGEVFGRATGISSEELHHFVFSRRQRFAQGQDQFLYKMFREQYPTLWEEYIEEYFKTVGLFPLYEMVVSLIHRLAVFEHFADQQGFVMRLLELIKQNEEDYPDVESFLEFFDELESDDLFVHVADSDSIRILTIHKAKGLEFPVVLIPSLGMDVQVGSGGERGQQSYLLDQHQDGLQLLRIKSKYLNYSPRLAAIREREYVKAFLSELNNIYVALTRAGQELMVVIPERVGSAFNIANLLIPAEITELGSRREHRAPAAVDMAERWRLPVSGHRDWLDYLRDEFPPGGAVARQDQALRGEVLHALLAQIGNTHEADLPALLKAAAQRVFPRYPTMAQRDELLTIVQTVLTSPATRRLMEVPDGEVFQEMDVVTAAGHTRRLDRLIVRKETVWVVDFKSRRDEAGRQPEQVREYGAILRSLYPGCRVQGFLIYLDDQSVVEVDL